jgi:lipoprotein signal peptidase
MAPWVYLVLFVSVIAADQLSKQWAIRSLSALTRSPPLVGLGGVPAIAVWLLAGAAGAWLCTTTPGGGIAALGGVAAWAAAGSNLGEWLVRGRVIDWLRLWPRSLTNLADAALIVGAAQLTIWMAVN